MSNTHGPLEGLEIVDCSTVLAGPIIASILGDLGAKVIKVEHPDSGDPSRGMGECGEELVWKWLGRNKKSICLDLHFDEGQDIFRDIVKDADVLVENFRPGTLEGWNIGWNKLSKINPNLVMVRVTGFGQTGPYRDRAAFGTIAEAMSGFAHINGFPDSPPTFPPIGLADKITALHGTFSALAALYWRDTNDGEGQYIDLSILESLFSLYGSVPINYGKYGVIASRIGNRSRSTAPSNTYETKDGNWIGISSVNNKIARRVLRTVGGEELVNDPRFENMEDRVRNMDQLDETIQDWMAELTADQIMKRFNRNDVPAAPVYDIEDIFNDDYFWERDAIIRINDEKVGEITMPGAVPKFSKSPSRVRHTGPQLGEHTREVIEEKSPRHLDELDSLQEAGIVKSQ